MNKSKFLTIFLISAILFFVFGFFDISRAADNPTAALLKTITTLLFIAGFTFLAALTLLALAIMLVIRYVYLTILLILSPIVWLLWIFPGTQSYWQTWWKQFLRWVFFAPIVFFFLYLTISTIDAFPKLFADYAGRENLDNQGFAVDVAYIGQLVAILGLLLGGLIAANSLGIAGAKTFYGAAQGAGKWFGGYVGRKGLQLGTGWLRKPKGEPGKEKSIADKVSEWSAKSRLTKIPLLGAVPGLAARGVARLSAAGGEDLVKKAKEAASKRGLNENIAMLGYADAPNRQGILQHLQEKDLLSKVPNAVKYLDKKYKDEFAKFGQGKAYSGIENSLGMNVAMKEALDRKDAAAFDREAEKFFKKLSDKDLNKIPYNAIYGEKPAFGLSPESAKFLADSLTKSMLDANPGNTRKILVNVNMENFDRAHSAVSRANSEIRRVDPAKADKVSLAMKKTLAKRFVGWEERITEEEESE
jgi:hypothetical protein